MMVSMKSHCFLPLSLLHSEDGLWGRDQVPRQKKPSWIMWKHSLLDHTDPTPMGLQDQGLPRKHGPHFTGSLSQRHHRKGRTEESSKPQGLGRTEAFLGPGSEEVREGKSSYQNLRGLAEGWMHDGSPSLASTTGA